MMISIPLRKWFKLLALGIITLMVGHVGEMLVIVGLGIGMTLYPIAALVNYWFAVRRLKEL